MSVVPAYERDPRLTELTTEVVGTGTEDGRPFAILADTILYPEGGGQPADRGFLGETPVLDVRTRRDGIRHYLAAAVTEGPARLRLDWARRFDHMQQHTGQHLLTAVAQDRFRWETTAFHLGERISDIELAAPKVPPERLRALEDAVAAEIRAARAVTTRRVAPDALAKLPVRTRGLPEGHVGDVRLVEIAGLDLNTCGGTHLASTAEIELVALVSTEAIRGGTRLFFVAGERARRRLAVHEERSAALRRLLGAPDEGLARSLEERLEKLKAVERTLRGIETKEAAEIAAALAGEEAAVVGRTFDGKPAAFLQSLSKEFLTRAASKTGLFATTSGGEAFFLLAVGNDMRMDVSAAGREVCALLGGKGGGSGRLFQGKAASLDGHPAALARLRALAG